MARAAALVFSRNGWDLLLAGRDLEATKAVGRDIALRAGRDQNAFAAFVFDAHAPETHQAFWEGLPLCPDGVLCAVGGGGDPLAAQHDPALAASILRANFTGLVPVFLLAADAFEARGHGLMIGIGSVAGDRGRAANYLYGSAKAGFATFLAGLRNRLAARGVQVITVKPGPAYTRMSEGLDLHPLVTAHPQEIGDAIYKAYRNKRTTVYVKPVWRVLMLVIVHIPEFIFNSLNLQVKPK
jgi:short-subunit dehydrogenase